MMLVLSANFTTKFSMLEVSVVGVEREQKGAEHAALGGSSVQHNE